MHCFSLLRIRQALVRFLSHAAGGDPEIVRIARGSDGVELEAGGSAHLVAYVGHNGLMEFSLPAPPLKEKREPGSSLVLACASKLYFQGHLRSAESHPVLLTTGLMAPEAYTLDAAIRGWVGKGTADAVVQAAAEAYDEYQKCGLRAARNLFWGEP